MLAALRSRALLHHSPSSSFSSSQQWKLGFPGLKRAWSSLENDNDKAANLLNLQEIRQILTDVKADDIRVIPVHKHCDFMVIATGRSSWHVKNIAQALIYKAKTTFSFWGFFSVHFKCFSSVWLPSKWRVLDIISSVNWTK